MSSNAGKLAEMSREECAHQACHCRPREGSEYCSEQCEKAGPEQTDCGCAHPECNAQA
jgi:hypothetical protein